MPRPSKAAALFLSSITRSELADQGTEVITLIVGAVGPRSRSGSPE